MGALPMEDEVDWFAKYQEGEEDYYPFQLAHPEEVEVLLLFMDPGYKIDRVVRRTVELKDGSLSEQCLESVAPSKVKATEGNYNRVRTFYFVSTITEEPSEENEDWGRIEEPVHGIDTVFPKSIQAMHPLNTIYVLYQRSCIKKTNSSKTRRRVQFKPSLSKTRRL